MAETASEAYLFIHLSIYFPLWETIDGIRSLFLFWFQLDRWIPMYFDMTIDINSCYCHRVYLVSNPISNIIGNVYPEKWHAAHDVKCMWNCCPGKWQAMHDANACEKLHHDNTNILGCQWPYYSSACEFNLEFNWQHDVTEYRGEIFPICMGNHHCIAT